METVLKNLKLLLLNFKSSPQKALSKSYQLSMSNETNATIVLICAVMAGIGNAIEIKYIPIRVVTIIDKTLSKFNLGGESDYFKSTYKPNLGKYFAIGLVLFIVVLLICTVISYAARTNLFKTSDNFLTIIKSTTLPLIPAVILLLIADIVVSFSIILYLLFLSFSAIAFVVYFYEHLKNITNNSKDTICLICSVSFLVILFICLRSNINQKSIISLLN